MATPWPAPPASSGFSDAGTTDAEAHGACDPLAGAGGPMALAEIELAGQAPDGSVLVLDRLPGLYSFRVFVSEGNILRRRAIVSFDEFENHAHKPGEGSIIRQLRFGEGGALSYRVAADPMLATVQWGDADECERIPGPCNATLTPIPKEDLARFSVQNVSRGRVIVSQELADGLRLFIVAPHPEALESEWRVFYGPPSRVQERKLRSTTSSNQGGTTDTVIFYVDGFAFAVGFDQLARTATIGKTSAEILAGVTLTCL